jgi:hypothetical protein
MIEGSEICNFHIQSWVELYSNFWSISNSKTGSATQFQAGCQRAATSRAHAPRVARPSMAMPARLPDASSARGRALPEAHTSRCSPLPKTPRVASPRRRTRALSAADPRSVLGAGRTCTGQGAVARQMLPVVTTPSPQVARIKGRRVLPLQPRHPRAVVPVRRAIAAAARAPPPPADPFTTCAPSTLPRTRGAVQGGALSTPSRLLAGGRAAAATAASRRRTPAPATPLPQPRPPVGPR